MDFLIREIKNKDIKPFLKCRETQFGSETYESFKKAFNSKPRTLTGCVAYHNGKAVGSMTYTIRNVMTNPQSVVPVAYAGAIGVLKNYQDTGLGSKMMSHAKEFLTKYAKAMFVITFFGRHPFGFYRKNNFIPLTYIQGLITDSENFKIHKNIYLYKGIMARNVIEQDKNKIMALFKTENNGVYGHWERKKGFYNKTIFRTILPAGPYALPSLDRYFYYKYEIKNNIFAYTISRFNKRKESVDIIEIGHSGNNNAVLAVISAVSKIGYQYGFKYVTFETTMDTELYEYFKQLGFKDNLTTKSTVAGQALDVDFMAKKCWLNKPETKNICLKVMTPYREVLFNAGKNRTIVDVMMEEHYLQRLLFNRLDFVQAVKLQEIKLFGNIELAERISKSIPYLKWDYCGLEYK